MFAPPVSRGTRTQTNAICACGIVAFDVGFEGRLVVARDEAQVRAVGLRVAEVAEVREAQAHEHGHIRGRAGDVGAGRRQIKRDFLAERPLVVPPRIRRRSESQRPEEQEQERSARTEETHRQASLEL